MELPSQKLDNSSPAKQNIYAVTGNAQLENVALCAAMKTDMPRFLNTICIFATVTTTRLVGRQATIRFHLFFYFIVHVDCKRKSTRAKNNARCLSIIFQLLFSSLQETYKPACHQNAKNNYTSVTSPVQAKSVFSFLLHRNAFEVVKRISE